MKIIHQLLSVRTAGALLECICITVSLFVIAFDIIQLYAIFKHGNEKVDDYWDGHSEKLKT